MSELAHALILSALPLKFLWFKCLKMLIDYGARIFSVSRSKLVFLCRSGSPHSLRFYACGKIPIPYFSIFGSYPIPFFHEKCSMVFPKLMMEREKDCILPRVGWASFALCCQVNDQCMVLTGATMLNNNKSQ